MSTVKDQNPAAGRSGTEQPNGPPQVQSTWDGRFSNDALNQLKGALTPGFESLAQRSDTNLAALVNRSDTSLAALMEKSDRNLAAFLDKSDRNLAAAVTTFSQDAAKREKAAADRHEQLALTVNAVLKSQGESSIQMQALLTQVVNKLDSRDAVIANLLTAHLKENKDANDLVLTEFRGALAKVLEEVKGAASKKSEKQLVEDSDGNYTIKGDKSLKKVRKLLGEGFQIAPAGQELTVNGQRLVVTPKGKAVTCKAEEDTDWGDKAINMAGGVLGQVAGGFLRGFGMEWGGDVYRGVFNR